jgi:hypothetical protein
MKKFLIVLFLFIGIFIYSENKKITAEDKQGIFFNLEYNIGFCFKDGFLIAVDLITREVILSERSYFEDKDGNFYYIGNDRITRKFVFEIDKNGDIITTLYGSNVEKVIFLKFKPQKDEKIEDDSPKFTA